MMKTKILQELEKCASEYERRADKGRGSHTFDKYREAAVALQRMYWFVEALDED